MKKEDIKYIVYLTGVLPLRAFILVLFIFITDALNGRSVINDISISTSIVIGSWISMSAIIIGYYLFHTNIKKDDPFTTLKEIEKEIENGLRRNL